VDHTHTVTNNDEPNILLRLSDLWLFLLGWHVGVPFGGLMFCLRHVGGNPRSILSNNIWWERYACVDHSNSSAAFTCLNSIYSANKMHGTEITNIYATLKNLQCPTLICIRPISFTIYSTAYTYLTSWLHKFWLHFHCSVTALACYCASHTQIF